MDIPEIRYSFEGKQVQSDIVRYVQSELNFLRSDFVHPTWQYLTTDGVFTIQTRDAIMGFQRFIGVSPNGVINRLLLDQIFTMRRKVDSYRQMQLYNKRYMEHQQQMQQQAQRPVPQSSFAETYVWPPLDALMLPVKNLLSGIAADIYSIYCGLKKLPLRSWWSYILGKLKALVQPKMSEMVEKLKSSFSFLKNVPAGVKTAGAKLKDFGAGLLKTIKASPAQIKTLFKVDGAKKFAKGNAVGIALAGLPAIYYFIRWIFCKDSEKDKFWNLFAESFKSFVGALILMAIIEVAAGAAVAAGVVTLEVSAVAAIIGLAVAFFDLLLVGFTGTGIGDYIMQGLDFLEVAIMETAIMTFNYTVDTVVDTGKAISKSIDNTVDNAARAYSRTLSDLFNPSRFMGF